MHSCHAPPTLNVCFYHYYTFALLFLHFIFLFCPGVGGQQLGPGMEPPAMRWVLAQPRLPGGGAQINALTGQHRCWWGLWSLAAMGWVPPLHPFCAAVGAPIPASRNSLRAFTSPPSPLLSRCPPPRLALLSPLLSSRPHPVPCLSHLTSMPQRPTAPPPRTPHHSPAQRKQWVCVWVLLCLGGFTCVGQRRGQARTPQLKVPCSGAPPLAPSQQPRARGEAGAVHPQHGELQATVGRGLGVGSGGVIVSCKSCG